MTRREHVLDGRTVFLSASFGQAAADLDIGAAEAEEVADAVAALARAVFTAGGRLVFGAHPTISPLILLVAAEHGRPQAIDIYQSSWFQDQVPSETLRLADLGLGRIHWVPSRPTIEESLSEMRRRMISESNPVGGLFVGGLGGISDEWALFGSIQPGRPRIPVHAPGGAAGNLQPDEGITQALGGLLNSRRYPVLAHAVVGLLGHERSRHQGS